jgi:hypothetical protein
MKENQKINLINRGEENGKWLEIKKSQKGLPSFLAQ